MEPPDPGPTVPERNAGGSNVIELVFLLMIMAFTSLGCALRAHRRRLVRVVA